MLGSTGEADKIITQGSWQVEALLNAYKNPFQGILCGVVKIDDPSKSLEENWRVLMVESDGLDSFTVFNGNETDPRPEKDLK